jgi:DNA-binding response OmpR family regulator
MKDMAGGNGVQGATNDWINVNTGDASDESDAVNSAIHFCLVASETDTIDLSAVQSVAEMKGWKIVKVRDGENTLRLLKVRNWDSVLLDENLPLLTPAQCVGRFRGWEERNRVNRQSNICLWSAACALPNLGSESMIQLPFGFDFYLAKPTRPEDVERMMTRAERNDSDFGIRSIVTR